MVVQILTATGLPSKISQFVITLAGDNLFLLALFVAITCLIFGMGHARRARLHPRGAGSARPR